MREILVTVDTPEAAKQMETTRALLHALPKTELHCHLDGSLRAATLLDLAKEYGKQLPRNEVDALREYMIVDDARNLTDYLERFDITLAVMQTSEALERIAYELAEDLARENVRYAEIRYCPALNIREGLSLDEAVEAPLRGLRQAQKDFGIRTGIIICGLRNWSPEISLEMAHLAVAFKNRGVIAFDLAGGELDNPAAKHREAFDLVAAANMAITVHAGEAYGPPSIHQAIHQCYARRIGHGTRLFEDPDLMHFVNDFRIPVEICMTSNVQTRAVDRIQDHPVRMYYELGMIVSLCTDNRMMSGVSVTDEYGKAYTHLGFAIEELAEVALMGFEAAFLPYAEKQAMIEAAMEEIEALL